MPSGNNQASGVHHCGEAPIAGASPGDMTRIGRISFIRAPKPSKTKPARATAEDAETAMPRCPVAAPVASNLLRALDLLFIQPIVNVAHLAHQLDMTFAGANHVATKLTELGILSEVTGNRRNRRFVYGSYVQLFRQLEVPEQEETDADRTQLRLPVDAT